MRDLQKQVKKLINYRIFDVSYVRQDDEGHYELTGSTDERVPHASDMFKWLVASKYALEKDEFGEQWIRVRDRKVSHSYDPFTVPQKPQPVADSRLTSTGEQPKTWNLYDEDRSLLGDLYAIGGGDHPPTRGTKNRKILDWVHRYGLFENTTPSPDDDPHIVPHRDITLSDFWMEAKDLRTLIDIAYLVLHDKLEEIVVRGREIKGISSERRLGVFEEHMTRWATYADRDSRLEQRGFRGTLVPMVLATDLEVRMQRKLERLQVGVSSTLFDHIAPTDNGPNPGRLLMVCADLRTALYALAALIVTGQVAVGYCERSRCGKPMVMTKPNRKYCSQSCRTLENQKRRS